MAQTNYTPIQLYHSTTTGNAPTTGNLVAGELAINAYDGILYYKNTATNTIGVLSTASSGAATVLGGATGSLLYQTTANVTGFLPLGTTNFLIKAGTTGPQYVDPAAVSVGISANLSGGATGSIPYQISTDDTGMLAIGTSGQVLTVSSGGVPTWASSGTATLATNLAGGSAGKVLYQSATDITAFTAAGTSGQVLLSGGTGSPTWESQSALLVGNATTSTNIAGGTTGALPYQTGSGVTAFLSLGSTNNVLIASTGGPQYVAQSTLSVGAATTSTNIAGGISGSIPYQSAANSTTLLGIGTVGQVLTVSSGGVPVWSSAGSSTIATNIAGGSSGTLVYQSSANNTSFVSSGVSGQLLVSSGSSAPSWTSPSFIAVGLSSNIAGGGVGSIPFQTASNATSFLNLGTSNHVLTAGAFSPQYVAQSTLSVGSATTATTATNLAGGATGSIPVQSSAGTTSLLSVGSINQMLIVSSGTPTWTTFPRTASVSTATTLTPNCDNTDFSVVSSLSSNLTIAAPTGTFSNGTKLTIRLTAASGSTRTLVWITSAGGYRQIGTTLPLTIDPTKTIYVGCVYNSSANFWDVIAVAQQA